MRRCADALALAALAALTLIFFWKLALTNLILVGVDIFTYFYPYRAVVNDALAHGRLPLWNPDLFMGVPLLANAQAGVLYPLNWPFVGLPAPQAVNVSIVLHVWLAGAFFLFFARDVLRLDTLGAMAGACVYAFSGYVGSLVEHVNQLQAAAWFPLILWSFERAQSSRRERLTFALVGGIALALQLLAGHAQVTYISLFGLVLWIVARAVQNSGLKLRVAGPRWSIQNARAAFRSLVVYLIFPAVICMIAAGLSAIQLLPTLELARLSIRAGGMTFREAVAFSLPLNKLLVSLLPTYGLGEPVFSEYVSFVGILALAFGLVAIARAWRQFMPLLVLAGSGLLLAVGFVDPLYFVFYKVVPGFGLFRVPARWLFLYVFAISGSAGIGLATFRVWLERKYVGRVAGLLPSVALAAMLVELFVASRSLPYNQPTAPEAFSFLRPSIAYLKAQDQSQPGRILSYSDLSWDPGDLQDIRSIYAGQLSAEAIYQYTVAAKAKEIVAPNLPMRYDLQSVDGYDGGILPLARFVDLESLFLTPEQVNPDGRLRERLNAVPDARWLDLFNVRYVIADKIFDVWVDGIYYDLGLGLDLPAGDRAVHQIDVPGEFTATAIGVISYLRGGATIADGIPVAELRATDASGRTQSFLLRAGRETAESVYGAGVAHAQARAVHTLRDQPNASEYQALLNFDTPTRLTSLSVRALQPAGNLVVHGITLVDGTTSTGRTLTFAQAGHFRLDQSGDVKLYEYIDAAPRAQVVHRADVLAGDKTALARMAQSDFDTRTQIVLAEGQAIGGGAAATEARIQSYETERLVLTTDDPAEGYLFLKDAWYPGWHAWVDGQPEPIERADAYFRAVHLSAGKHSVEFRFEPESLRWGAIVTALSLVLCAVLSVALAAQGRSGRL